MPAAHRIGEQLNIIRVGEPAARFHRHQTKLILTT